MDYQTELYSKLNTQADEVIRDMPDFARKFFYHLRDIGASPRTKLQYAYDMRRFFDFLGSSAGFSGKDLKAVSASDILDNLTIDDIHEYMDTLEYYNVQNGDKIEKRLASPSVKARRISSLRSFYKYYFKIGEISNNLADLMDIPKIPDKQIVVMDKDQVNRILAAVRDISGLTEGQIKRHNKILKRDYAIMMLFLGTGLRVSELVGIDTGDIDFYNASILVTRKGGDQDEVFFGPEVEEALLDYVNDGRLTLLGENSYERAFFLSMQHKRLGVRQVEGMVKNYAAKAGININLSPHALRRTFGTALYESTNDIYLVADALHHSSVETTKKHYARMSRDHKRVAARESSNLFKKD